MTKCLTLLMIFAVCGTPFKASASEGIFAYLYTAETTPGDHWEYEQKQTWRSGKARGQYDAIDLRNEFEYGITDRLQGALYLNSTYLRSTDQYNTEDVTQNVADKNEFNVDGVSVELMYRVLSPYKDGLGLAFYLEPEMSLRDHMSGDDRIERALEGRVILQKNFLDDQLYTATNFMIEPEWEKADGLTKKELWAEWTAGISYRWKSNWFLGLEFRNHMEFIDMKLDNQEHSAYFLGPNVHYGGEKYWWTATFLPQISGWPRDLGIGADGQSISDSRLHLGQHEKFEVRISVGIPLGEEHSHNE
jgi:hypothetical protein